MYAQVKCSAGTVLLLEDEPLIALDVEEILNEAGFNDVRIISSCRDANSWLSKGEPVVVIVDPGLRDGLCYAVVRLLVERKIPFVVHSGDDHSLVEEEPAFARGYWLSKPSMPADMVKAISVAMTGVGA